MSPRFLLRASAPALTLCAAVGVVSLGALPAPVQAQSTVTVQLNSTSFNPKNITIQVGDKVRWNWATGLHNVVSGQSGTPDDIFNSGLFSAPHQFEVVFDAAFVASNRMPNDRYDYYCLLHLPGMTGSVTVQGAPAGEAATYGESVNPAGSLRLQTGSPAIGTNFTLRLQNPDDPSAGPGVGLLFFATSPDPSFPLGTVLPGFGLSPSPAGELLLSLVPPDPAIVLGPQLWSEGGTVDFVIPLPGDPNLVGQSLYAQGALVDTTTANGIGLPNGLQLTFG
jgi:plastocyanin